MANWIDEQLRLVAELRTSLVAEREDNARLREALDTIGGGHTTRFPGAPDMETATSPVAWRSDMWEWSERVARAALAAPEQQPEPLDDGIFDTLNGNPPPEPAAAEAGEKDYIGKGCGACDPKLGPGRGGIRIDRHRRRRY